LPTGDGGVAAAEAVSLRSGLTWTEAAALDHSDLFARRKPRRQHEGSRLLLAASADVAIEAVD